MKTTLSTLAIAASAFACALSFSPSWSKQDGLSRIFDSKHEGVTDRLDLRCPKHRQLGADDGAEVRHQRCGLFVSVCLGQRREAGYVGKQERGR